MFIDADFNCMWHQEHSAIPDNVLSCPGYIIMFFGCPIHLASKLQNGIALSAAHCEYIALSMASHDFLPIRCLLEEINKYSLVHFPRPEHYNHTYTWSLTATQIWEDSTPCIVLAHSKGCKQWTKHISIKWHHFRDQIRAGYLKIVKIVTNYKWADILTKPLGREKFETLWKAFLNWQSCSMLHLSYAGALAQALQKSAKGYENNIYFEQNSSQQSNIRISFWFCEPNKKSCHKRVLIVVQKQESFCFGAYFDSRAQQNPYAL